MKIILIGTGNTAYVLGRKLLAAGHEILQVYGRDTAEASALAYELDTESTNYWNVVNRTADLYIIAVSDIAISEVVVELQLQSGTLVHTAASVPMEVLAPAQRPHGVLYPLQSLNREVGRLPPIPVLVEGSDEPTGAALRALAGSISDTVHPAGAEERARLHLAAVFCNNFVNHLYTLAARYCEEEGLDFKLLLPLIEETALRLRELPPSRAQTGPALRGDTTTLERHRQLLENHPQLLQFYNLFSESIASR